MAEAGARGTGAYVRSASFRRSFLVSYAVRIAERLDEATTTATADYGKELVPVLQRQADAVQVEFERLFPDTYSIGRARQYSRRGWEAGRAAADDAPSSPAACPPIELCCAFAGTGSGCEASKPVLS